MGATTTDGPGSCAGTLALPTAPAGTLCIYVAAATNAVDLQGLGIGAGTPYGFKLTWDSGLAAGDTSVDAVWAYTAP